MLVDVIGTRRRPESPRGRGSDVKRTEKCVDAATKFSWRERARRAKERRRGEALAPHKTKTKRTKRAIRRRRIERKREIPKFWNPLPRGILGYSPELPTRKTQKVQTIGMLTIDGTLLSCSHTELSQFIRPAPFRKEKGSFFCNFSTDRAFEGAVE